MNKSNCHHKVIFFRLLIWNWYKNSAVLKKQQFKKFEMHRLSWGVSPLVPLGCVSAGQRNVVWIAMHKIYITLGRGSVYPHVIRFSSPSAPIFAVFSLLVKQILHFFPPKKQTFYYQSYVNFILYICCHVRFKMNCHTWEKYLTQMMNFTRYTFSWRAEAAMCVSVPWGALAEYWWMQCCSVSASNFAVGSTCKSMWRQDQGIINGKRCMNCALL